MLNWRATWPCARGSAPQEKPRERRYETANGLARDIQRYLADEAVEARPPSAGYRFGKFVSRHRGTVAFGSTIAALVIVGSVVSAWLAVLVITQ